MHHRALLQGVQNIDVVASIGVPIAYTTRILCIVCILYYDIFILNVSKY